MQIDGEAVRRLRELNGFTVAQFAEHVGISTQYVRNIENGARLLKKRPDLIKKMADVLGVPIRMVSGDGL